MKRDLHLSIECGIISEMRQTMTINHLYVQPEEAMQMGKDTPWRRRENIVMLCKAIIKYAEGPGDIDSQVHEVCDKLGNLVELMKDAHHRAIEEQRAIQLKFDQRKTILKNIPKELLRQVVLDYFREHPDEIPVEGDWSTIEAILNR